MGNQWEYEIRAIEARAAKYVSNVAPILFAGSSSIRMWETLAEDFAPKSVVNHGFGGSQMSDLVYYFDRVFLSLNPQQVIIFSGGNDLDAGVPVEEVAQHFATLCERLKLALPETKVTLIGIAPNPARWSQRGIQQQLIEMTSHFCERNGCGFIDVWTPMMGSDGLPSRDLYLEDQLHMNAAGYALWREIVGPHLVD